MLSVARLEQVPSQKRKLLGSPTANLEVGQWYDFVYVYSSKYYNKSSRYCEARVDKIISKGKIATLCVYVNKGTVQHQFRVKSATDWSKLASHGSQTDGRHAANYLIKKSELEEKTRIWVQDEMRRVFGDICPKQGSWCVCKVPDYQDPYFEARLKEFVQSDKGTSVRLELFDEGKLFKNYSVSLVGKDGRKLQQNANKLLRHGGGRGTVVEKERQEVMAKSIEEEKRRIEKARAKFDEAKNMDATEAAVGMERQSC